MLKRFALAVVLVLALTGISQAGDWTVDGAHSSVQFKVTHLVISKVTGKFTSFSGNLSFDPENLADGSVEMTVDVNSVDTDNENRDKHLKSPDFFEVEKFPTMTFKSTKIVAEDSKKFKLIGDLTIKGTTKEVTFDCVFNGATQFMGHGKAGFSATTTINRKDFGLSWSKTLETGGLVVGDDVEIMLELEVNAAS